MQQNPRFKWEGIDLQFSFVCMIDCTLGKQKRVFKYTALSNCFKALNTITGIARIYLFRRYAVLFGVSQTKAITRPLTDQVKLLSIFSMILNIKETRLPAAGCLFNSWQSVIVRTLNSRLVSIQRKS